MKTLGRPDARTSTNRALATREYLALATSAAELRDERYAELPTHCMPVPATATLAEAQAWLSSPTLEARVTYACRIADAVVEVR